jgi:hypothetical protein
LVYTGFWFIQGFGLNRILVYSGFGSYRIQVYSGVWFIHDSDLFRFWFIQGFGLYRILNQTLNKPESCLNQTPE